MNRTVRHSYPRILAIAAVALVAVIAIVLATSGGEDDGYVVRAEFRDAAGLRKNSDVKIGGVPGGKITKIALTAKDTAIVTMKLRDGAVPIGTGATADARPVNLLGEKYVDLRPGDLKRAVDTVYPLLEDNARMRAIKEQPAEGRAVGEGVIALEAEQHAERTCGELRVDADPIVERGSGDVELFAP